MKLFDWRHENSSQAWKRRDNESVNSSSMDDEEQNKLKIEKSTVVSVLSKAP